MLMSLLFFCSHDATTDRMAQREVASLLAQQKDEKAAIKVEAIIRYVPTPVLSLSFVLCASTPAVPPSVFHLHKLSIPFFFSRITNLTLTHQNQQRGRHHRSLWHPGIGLRFVARTRPPHCLRKRVPGRLEIRDCHFNLGHQSSRYHGAA